MIHAVRKLLVVFWALGLALAPALPAGAIATAPDQKAQLSPASQEFAKLADEYWETQMRLSPLWATFINYGRYNDKLDDNTPAGRAYERKAWADMLARLNAMDPKKLTESERVSWDTMKMLLELRVEYFDYKFHQWEVDHLDGPQAWIPSLVEVAQPMATAADAEALLTRMAAVKPYFEQHIANLKEGAAEGKYPARKAVERTIEGLEGQLKKKPAETPFAAAARKLPDSLRKEYEPKILKAVEDSVFPGFRHYKEFLEKDSLKNARPYDKPGIVHMPNGPAAYRWAIRYHTTVDKTPQELHQTGLDELKAIHAEMRTIADRMGHKGDLNSFMDKISKNPRNFFTTRQEVLKDAERLVAKAKAKLPEFFGILPKTPMVVKPIEDYKEKNEPAARYFSPPDDLSRPGIYYINTYEPKTRARYSMASLAVHEGVPGHHMQLAIAVEQTGLPAFRRHGGFTAFAEGWALYAERVGIEMGMYEDDLSRLGMLSDQGLRASRLVVDTGIHAMGWSRQQAIDFMKANIPESEHEIIIEVDRYTIWPGQALAYKVGQREIMALREEAQKRLGDKFDIRAFHDTVLKNGSIPLPTLRKVVLGES